MFRHVVMFAWTEETTEETRLAIRDGLAALPGVIPEIRDYRLGDDAGVASGNFDFVVVADFDDSAGWLAYRDHPTHQRIRDELILPAAKARSAIQYHC